MPNFSTVIVSESSVLFVMSGTSQMLTKNKFVEWKSGFTSCLFTLLILHFA